MIQLHDPIVIVSAQRTAVGSFGGGLSSVPAHDLGAAVIKHTASLVGVDPAEIDEVILGQVLTAGHGQNPARQAALNAGLSHSSTAFGINQVCGAGLRAVALGMQQVALGDANIVVAGGQESMSMAHHSGHMRDGTKMGDLNLSDTMIKDGLWDAFHDYHMGITAENVAERFQISRETQDAFALESQRKASEAQKSGRFNDEITPFTVQMRRSETVIDKDEYIRHGATLETMQKLRPAFKRDGTVTAANASGLNDGAAVVMLMRASEAEKRGLTPLARIASWATAGVAPEVMGTGPIPASTLALKKAGWSVADLDLVEANEAFASQAIAVNQEMGWNPDIVNVNGGAIAIGHPIGASGCRVLVTLVHELKRRGLSKGLATLCIGGGMGMALTLTTDI
jgi:acetyl-CoA C-acetyltransferase